MALTELQRGIAQQIASNNNVIAKREGEGAVQAALADAAARTKPCKKCGLPYVIGKKCKPCHAAAERAKYAAAHPGEPPMQPEPDEPEQITGYMIRNTSTWSSDSGPVQLHAGRRMYYRDGDAGMIGDLQRVGDIELIALTD